MPTKKKRKGSLLGKKLKFNKIQAFALIGVVAVVGIVAFALTHAAAYPAHVIINVVGPSNQSITFDSSGPNPYDNKAHDVGICLRSIAVQGSRQCDGNTIGPVSITAPVVSGYTFSGWSSCDGTSPSGASCNLQGYTNASKTITATYQSNTTASGPSSIDFTVRGLPAGTTVGFTSTTHDIGLCYRSWTVVAGSTTTCTSGPNPSGGYYGIGSSDTKIYYPTSVTSGGQTYKATDFCSGYGASGGCNGSASGSTGWSQEPNIKAFAWVVYTSTGQTTPTVTPTVPVTTTTPSTKTTPTTTITTPNATAGPGQTVNTGGQIAVGTSSSTVTPATITSLSNTGNVICAGSCSTANATAGPGQVANTGGNTSIGNSSNTPTPIPSLPQTVTTAITSPFVSAFNFIKGIFGF